MSEHDIEQATEESYRRFPDCGSTRYGFIEGFRSGLPLIASAREEGARDMRERAAKRVMTVPQQTRWHISREMAAEAIRALPLKEG